MSVLCGNNRDGLKCEWMVDEDGGWKSNMKCFGFFSVFNPLPFPPPKKPYSYPPPLALMYWSWEVVFPLARCRTLKAQLWCSGLWLWMSLRWKVRFFLFSSLEASCAGISPFLAKRMKLNERSINASRMRAGYLHLTYCLLYYLTSVKMGDPAQRVKSIKLQCAHMNWASLHSINRVFVLLWSQTRFFDFFGYTIRTHLKTHK